jgi:tetratricopeptide (TPR) repeat protein
MALAPLGMAYRGLRDLPRAEQCLQRALELDPTSLEAAGELVNLYDASGRRDDSDRLMDSLESRRDLLRERGDHGAELHLIRARNGIARGGSPGVIAGQFRQAILLDADNARARLEFARWLDRSNRHAEAVPVLREGLKRDPRHLELAAHLAWDLAETGTDLDEARRWLQLALQVEPGSPYLADTAAWIEHRAGNHALAWQKFAPALAVVKEVPEVAFHAAAILTALDRETEAIAYLRQALAATQPFPGRDEAIRLQQSLVPRASRPAGP